MDVTADVCVLEMLSDSRKYKESVRAGHKKTKETVVFTLQLVGNGE